MFFNVWTALLLVTILNTVRAVPQHPSSDSSSSTSATSRSSTSASRTSKSTTKPTTSRSSTSTHSSSLSSSSFGTSKPTTSIHSTSSPSILATPELAPLIQIHSSSSTVESSESRPSTKTASSSSSRLETPKSTSSIQTPSSSHTSKLTNLISTSRPTTSAATTSKTNSSAAESSAAPSWAKTCLYEPVAEGGDCNRPGDPVWGGYNNPYDTSMFRSNIVPANPSLASHCSSMFMSAENLWLSTAAITSTTYPGITNTDLEEGPSTTISVGYTEAYYNEFWTYTAEPPCCLNCTLFGGNVQVYYWPTPAPSPPTSTLVDAAGFTFISPSIYVAFQSLHATNLCGAVGPTYKSTTLAFAPNELSTAMAWDTNPDDGSLPWDPYIPNDFSLANFAGQKNCSNITTVIWQGDGAPYYTNEAAATSAIGTDWEYEINWWTITYNPCSPTLSVPTQLFTINSMWTGCMQGIDAFYDPPYALSSGGGLKPFSTTVDPAVDAPAKATPDPYVPANAGPTPKPVTPNPTSSATATPNPKPNNAGNPAIASPKKDPPASPSNDPTVNTAKQDPPAPSPGKPDSDPAQSAKDDPPASPKNDPAANTGKQDPPSSPLPTPNDDPPANAHNDPPAQSVSQDPNADPPQSPNNDPLPNTANQPPHSPSPVPNHGTSPSTANSGNGLPPSSQTPFTAAPAAIATIGGSTLTANSASAFIIGSATLTAGGQVTISGTAYSLASNGVALAIGTSTTYSLITTQPTVAEYVIGSQTLVAGGPAITVSGTSLSLLPGGQSVVVNGNIEAASSVFSGGTTEIGSSSQGMGGIIVSLGGFDTPGSSSSTATTSYVQVGGGNYSGVLYTGEAVREGSGLLLMGLMAAAGIVIVGTL